jgi:hypothetical protein
MMQTATPIDENILLLIAQLNGAQHRPIRIQLAKVVNPGVGGIGTIRGESKSLKLILVALEIFLVDVFQQVNILLRMILCKVGLRDPNKSRIVAGHHSVHLISLDKLVGDLDAKGSHWVTLFEGVHPDLFIKVIPDSLFASLLQIHYNY